ncbi:hypothetical protein [Dactylosporangium sp. NPDC051541]|uniref:hypothetical protein n=1 Tax=Dactylosporangium sp. NPDC051541 TaxID=3363977 RepID=UPI0037927A5C
MQRPANRWTVGPLPSSVYWRRRAMVGVVIVGVLLLVWILTRGGGGGTPPTATSAPASGQGGGQTVGATTTGPGGGAGAPGPSTDPSAPPQIIPASPDASGQPAAQHSAPPANIAACTDDQIAVTVTVLPSPGPLGGTFTFNISIASKAADWCSRDLGGGAQEIQILRAGTLLFSSDDCNTKKDTDVRAFAAGDAVTYRIQWNSYRATPHVCAVGTTPAPEGTYQVVARVGSKLSPATDFAIKR